VAGDDHDREPQTGAHELPLQIEAAGAGQVRFQAPGPVRARRAIG
jgi:hypothetical protein